MKTVQPESEEQQGAQQTIQAFVAAFKSFALYPEEHVFNRTNIEKFKSQLETFLEQYEEFPLTIEKNTFSYKGELIFEGGPEEINPAYLMTRDGLVRLNFLRGIELVEIRTLLSILNHHKSAADDSGGDIVTSLWHEELTHVEYEEVDIFALEGFDFDLGTLRVAPEEKDLAGESERGQVDSQRKADGSIVDAAELETGQGQSMAQLETVTNLLRMEQSLEVLVLTPQEKLMLQSYVEEEERKDYTNDVIDVLLIILISQKNRAHFNQVLEFLVSVFFDTMDRGEFHLAYKLCSNILTIRDKMQAIRPWTRELVDNFIRSLSTEEQWSELSWIVNPHLLVFHRQHFKFLFQVLRLLTPDVMLPLGPFMARIDMDNIDVRNELFAIIENKAKKDPEKLSELLSRSDEKINQLLFPLVEDLDSNDAAMICLQMTRHDSVVVRRSGLNGYFSFMSDPDPEALFSLLMDEDSAIVGRVLDYLLAQGDKEQAESMLLRFLEQAVHHGIERDHMFEYYRALSECGSFRSVRVLKKILLESRLKEMFSHMNAVHKKGSALALKILGTEDAMIILRKGAKSMRPDIRLASQFALEKVQ